MRVQDARLLASAGSRAEFPADGLPEVAFAGRSNVGKSTLLNRLVDRRGLARTSGRPGCTQRIHFYVLNRRLLFVDLPGYGYARAPESVRAAWKPLVESYLDARAVLRLLWLLVDARHPPTAQDVQLAKWLQHVQIPFRVALTKGDRISGNQRPEAMRRCSESLGLGDDNPPLLTSARDGDGVQGLWREIERHVRPPRKPASGPGGGATAGRRAPHPGAPSARSRPAPPGRPPAGTR